ncbi:hypothetical protein [Slackia isoflavoniconvertens]|uniref:hypothetical protein n=1 Tax=Slackia isoflavoniconvertens TaxID=572010 RepID=UPI003AEF43CB
MWHADGNRLSDYAIADFGLPAFGAFSSRASTEALDTMRRLPSRIKQPGIREPCDAGGAHAKLSRGIRRRHGWDVRQLAGHGERDNHPAALRLMA